MGLTSKGATPIRVFLSSERKAKGKAEEEAKGKAKEKAKGQAKGKDEGKPTRIHAYNNGTLGYIKRVCGTPDGR